MDRPDADQKRKDLHRCAEQLRRQLAEVGPNHLPLVDAAAALLTALDGLERVQQAALETVRQEAIEQLAVGLTHASRNALQRAKACLEMLRLEIPDRPHGLELVDRTRNALTDLALLYDRVCAYAAPLDLNLQVHDLGDIVQEAWDNLSDQRKDRPVHWVEERETEDLRCNVDRRSMVQLFRNILENSLAACPDRIEIGVHWSVAQIDSRPALQVAVRDNGLGLTDQQKARIFQPLYTTRSNSSGFGMAIAQRITDAHGGRIVVGDGRRVGTEIVITLLRRGP